MTEFTPDTETAAVQVAKGESVLLTAVRVDDLEPPVSAYLKLAARATNTFLLDSVEGGAFRGRYSAIGLEPDLIWRSDGEHAKITRIPAPGGTPDDLASSKKSAPLESLRQLIVDSAMPLPSGLPSIAAGLFGYLSYDTIRQIECLPDHAAADPLNLPEGQMLRPRVMVVFDALRQEILATAPVRPRAGIAPDLLVDAARRRIEAVFSQLDAPIPITPDGEKREMAAPESNMGESEFREKVRIARDYIRAGDIFQVVPSQRFSAPFIAPPFSLYRSLRRTNPSPFLYFFNLPGFSIAGSSPEIMVRLRDRVVTIRPIAGTRPRGYTEEVDLAHETDLLTDAKERAEHLMLLDLGRNDVGRVSAPGSVRVTEREVIERYSHVMHLVSNVEGDLREGEDALSALMAGFPPGTLSGAPKVRAMEIIDELEPHRRGLYGGAVGYFSADGNMDFAIALRTAVIRKGRMHVQAGAGVVLDSDPEAERQETVNKASALFQAASEAWRFA